MSALRCGLKLPLLCDIEKPPNILEEFSKKLLFFVRIQPASFQSVASTVVQVAVFPARNRGERDGGSGELPSEARSAPSRWLNYRAAVFDERPHLRLIVGDPNAARRGSLSQAQTHFEPPTMPTEWITEWEFGDAAVRALQWTENRS